jgi:cytochrome c oxidase cbb3-type subunit 2
VGGRYSDEWHVDHLIDPQSVVPESVMPKYGFLRDRRIEPTHIAELMATHRLLGVPYTDEMIENAAADFRAQIDPFGDTEGLLARYPKAQVRNFDGQPGISEMDALIAYMQMLGTLVDFSTFEAVASR